ncbi:MAG: 5-dehydro-2-deoxygluconokinase [Anaerolineaceae bacterium]|nr:5-dehydro-2-deoxygluconokinase [Anaerolineaceae bacterium]
MAKSWQSLHMGRSSIDLYSNDIGSPFVKIDSFAAYVGGSPTNISVGATRLGAKAALLTAVGEDPVGDFLLHFLREEGVPTDYIPRKAGMRSSCVLLGIEPPDRFPLQYYRDNCADINLTIDDVLAAPVTDCEVFQFAGTNLSLEPSRTATMFAAELARQSGARVVFDIDFRPDQWSDIRAFGVVARSTLPLVDVVLGTEDEINAATLSSVEQMELTHSQVSDAKVTGDTLAAIGRILESGPEAVVEKVGAQGARIHLRDGEIIEAPGFPVKIYNILGAGDAFGAGFLYGLVRDWGWYRSARLGNACGAIVVTKHGCADFMPTMAEVDAFVAGYGGLD